MIEMGLKSNKLTSCLLLILTSANGITSQSTSNVSCKGDKQLDLAFLVDSSASVCASSSDKFYFENCKIRDEHGACFSKVVNCSNWQKVLDFTTHVVDSLTIGSELVQVSVALFGDKPILQWNLDEYNTSSSLIQAIRYNLPYLKSFETKIDVGLNLALEKVFNPLSAQNRPDVPDLLIVITDGRTTTGSSSAKKVSMQLQELKVHLVTIGITPGVNKEELCEIASPSNSSDQNDANCFFSDNFGDLDRILSVVTSLACRLSATKTTTPLTTASTATTTTTPTGAAITPMEIIPPDIIASTTTVATTTPTTTAYVSTSTDLDKTRVTEIPSTVVWWSILVVIIVSLVGIAVSIAVAIYYRRRRKAQAMDSEPMVSYGELTHKNSLELAN